MTRRLKGTRLAAAAVMVILVGSGAALVVYASRDDGTSSSTRVPQATPAQLAAARLDELPLAPANRRIDLVAQPFSNPTRVTNPLFPISSLRSAILSGTVDGKPFKVETTLLPETRLIAWPEGRRLEALVSQYVAYLDGRIEEVALDFYAQADDGSVWYLGEDVFNYKDGLIADTDGTWVAGKEGPGAMIMPAHPRIGDVYRPENAPGLVFEEVRVKAVGKTVNGPRGAVEGAIVADELHQDGMREEKTFAPGYGEFFTGAGGDVEAIALALPADKLPGPPPAELKALSAGADDVFVRAGAGDWKAASARVGAMTAAWKSLQAGAVPPRLETDMSRAMDRLVRAVGARNAARARHAAIGVAQVGLDLQLRHRPAADIDRARLELWTRQLLVDSTARDAGGVSGDIATLEWIRDRIAHTFGTVDRTRLDAELGEIRGNVKDSDLRGAAATAERLRDFLAGIS